MEISAASLLDLATALAKMSSSVSKIQLAFVVSFRIIISSTIIFIVENKYTYFVRLFTLLSQGFVVIRTVFNVYL